MPGRWKESLGTPVFRFFGGEEQKGAKGKKNGEGSSNIQRKKTWKVQKLKRAVATLPSQEERERRRHGWPRRLNPLERRDQAKRFG
jgi:hypothetical protein